MKNYDQIIEAKVKAFWSVGDQVTCVRVFRGADTTCELCGHSPISGRHVLQNWRSGKTLIVGSKCVIEFRGLATQLQRDFRVGYRAKNRKAAELIEGRAPGTTFILPEQQVGYEIWDEFCDADSAELDAEISRFIEYAQDFARSREDGWFYDDDEAPKLVTY